MEMAAGHGAAIPGIAVTDTIKELNEDNTIQSTIPGEKYGWLKPPGLPTKIDSGAYQQASLLGSRLPMILPPELMDYPVQYSR